LNRALTDLGQPLYGCISPDGYACTQTAWLDPGGLLRRISFAADLGNGIVAMAISMRQIPNVFWRPSGLPLAARHLRRLLLRRERAAPAQSSAAPISCVVEARKGAFPCDAAIF
jgi:hypothetical protein